MSVQAQITELLIDAHVVALARTDAEDLKTATAQPLLAASRAHWWGTPHPDLRACGGAGRRNSSTPCIGRAIEVPRRLATTAAAGELTFEPIRGKKKSGKRGQGKGGGRRGRRALAQQARRDERKRAERTRHELERLNEGTGFALPGEAA